jgi:hypothetical protein
MTSPLKPGKAGKSSFCIVNSWFCWTMAFTETPCFLKEAATAPAAQPCQATIGVFQYLYMHILIVFLQPICGMESTV